MAERSHTNVRISPAVGFGSVSIQFSAKTSAVRIRLPRRRRSWSDYADSIHIRAIWSYIGMRKSTSLRFHAFTTTVSLLSAKDRLASGVSQVLHGRMYPSGWLMPSTHVAEMPIPATTGFLK